MELSKTRINLKILSYQFDFQLTRKYLLFSV